MITATARMSIAAVIVNLGMANICCRYCIGIDCLDLCWILARRLPRYSGISATNMSFASITEAIEETRAGRMLVVVDDEDRENEGDLTIAAEKITPDVINFMATYGRGLICLTLTGERCDTLRLPLMSPHNTSNRSEEHTSELQSPCNLVCRLLLEKKQP